ncbi:hypothetical protein OEZ86_011733 [Tetradesmus obliquus]|nr:hypothetical protein OEZ86_011733 [Tetradesmus obliquus]
MTVPSLQDICIETVARRMPYEVTFTCEALPIPELVQRVYSWYTAIANARRAAGIHSPAAHLAALRQFATCWQPQALALSLPGTTPTSSQALHELAAFSASLAHLQLACPAAASLSDLAPLRRLTCLGLRGCSSVTPEALQQLLAAMPQLLALDLSGLGQVSDSLAPTLVQLKQLLVLQLSATSCSDATIEWLTYGSRLHEWQRQQQQQQQQGGSCEQTQAVAQLDQAVGDWPRTCIRQWHLAHTRVTARAAELLLCCPDIIFLDLRGSESVQGGLSSVRSIAGQRLAPRHGVHKGIRVGSKVVVSRAQALQTQQPIPPPLQSVESLPGIAVGALTGAGKDDLDMSKTVLGIILGGGAGTRLYPLTKKRAKPAVPLGANYRLIDIPVSNCVNSNVTKIYCLTQFNSASLNRHLSQAYNSSVGAYTSRGFVEVLAASQSNVRKEWFQGTADAVRQYMWLFEEAMRDGVQDFLILSGDHLYRMDYKEFVRKHRESGAAITIAALPCDEKRASAFGLMKIDDEGRVIEFAEKPSGDALKAMQVDTTVLGVDAKTAAEKPYIASMGIYVMTANVLKELLENHMPTANDFGNEVIPEARKMGYPVQAYAFQGYWEDIGTIEAFYNANLALVKTDGSANFSFYDKEAPIYTMSRFLPPSKVLQDVVVRNAIIGDGSNIKARSRVSNSIIGLRSLIGEDVVMEDTLMLGSDYYETVEECAWVPGCLPMGVGNGSHIRKALIDKNARIGERVQILNKDNVQEANREAEGFMIRDGIVCVIKDSVIPSGTVI